MLTLQICKKTFRSMYKDLYQHSMMSKIGLLFEDNDEITAMKTKKG